VLGEIILVNITKVMPHGAYCELVEYKADAYLPIGEVASGWIKNIREFIKEGQKDVAKVVFVDANKKALDISLKKVTAKEKKDKINDYTLEKRAEKFFNQSVQAAHKEDKAEEIKKKVSQYATTYSELLDMVYEGKDPAGALDADIKKAFLEIIAKNIKPKIYSVTYSLEFKSLGSTGTISKIKKAFAEVEKLGIGVLYEGAPHYKLTAKGPNYPDVEGRIKEAQAVLQKYEKDFSVTLKK
jgi:translation initiation factor 2 subunit 1